MLNFNILKKPISNFPREKEIQEIRGNFIKQKIRDVGNLKNTRE